MPKIIKDEVTYDILFKEDMTFTPYKSKMISHTFKKDSPLFRGLDKDRLIYFYNLPIYEKTKIGFGLGGKILFNPREDFYFVEVRNTVTQVVKTTVINPENI